jgi:hypothetical protein
MNINDKNELRTLRLAINSALVEVGRTFNVKLEAGNCKFTDHNATFKLEASIIGSNGQALNSKADDFTRYCRLYGMEPADLGRTISVFGTTYIIAGLSSKSHRFPVLAARADEKVFKLPADAVVAALKTSK